MPKRQPEPQPLEPELVRAGGSYVVREPGAAPELVHRTRAPDEAPAEAELRLVGEEVSDACP